MPCDRLRANGLPLGMSTPVVALPEEGLRCYVGSGDCHVVLPKEGLLAMTYIRARCTVPLRRVPGFLLKAGMT